MSKAYNCDLCGSKDAVEVPYARLYTNDQPVHICKSCGFVYVRERRTPQEIAKTWSEELFGGAYTAKIPAVKARQMYVADFIDAKIGLQGKKLIDIGGGEGQFSLMARDLYQADIFAIEPSKQNCESMSNMGIACYEGTIEEYLEQKDKQQADIVTIMWTLENCAFCRDMINGARDLLADDGYIVVATGSRILVPFKKPLYDYLSTNPADTHAFRFSANTLRGILAVSGFRPEHINRFLDTDYLCVIAGKSPKNSSLSWAKDDYLMVHDFFERWHRETIHYRTQSSYEH
ncbi:class I SAM-dependent methyltransferase [Fibrobacterota bacterium]